MVFYYSIRGGQCLNDSKDITLSSDDIICYVGRDKHENEHLIKYGWPGDIVRTAGGVRRTVNYSSLNYSNLFSVLSPFHLPQTLRSGSTSTDSPPPTSTSASGTPTSSRASPSTTCPRIRCTT